MKKEPKILVAIPVYNCQKQIGRVLDAFDERLLKRIDKILVIDNRSTDNTVKEASSYQKKIRKLQVNINSENYSLGGSHKVAFLYALKNNFDYVAILHGDDQAETSELNKFIDYIITNPKIDAVLGCRFMRGSRLIGYDQKRVLGNKILNAVFSVIMLERIRDLGSGLNIYKTKRMADEYFVRFGDDLGFNIDLLLYLVTSNAEVAYLPITWKEEDQVSNARNLRIAKMALARLMKWRFGIPPRNKYGRLKSDYKSESVAP